MKANTNRQFKISPGKNKGDIRVERDGLVFYVPDREIPITIFKGALITFFNDTFTAHFERSDNDWHRKSYASMSRLQRWICEVEKKEGGFKPLDEKTERLMVLVEHTRTWGDLPNWRYGRLLRHHFQQFARTLVLFEGDTEPTELGFNPDLYVCDDPALAKRIRDIEEEIEAWNEEREYFKKKLTRKIGHHELRFRASLVKLAKAQMRRLKTKA